jgi:oligogalacturonide lyase
MLTGTAAAQSVPSEKRRYADPATELDVLRLTDPNHASFLLPSYNLMFSRRSDTLVYLNDRSGSLQAYSMELKSGVSQPITNAAALDSGAITVTPDQRSVCYIDSGRVILSDKSGGRAREIYKLSTDYVIGSGLCVTADGPSALVADGSKLLMISLGPRRLVTTVADAKMPIAEPMARPRRASVLYRGPQGALFLSHLDGTRTQRLRTAQGGTGAVRWSADGRTIFYISIPEEKIKPYLLRELDPDTGEDKPVSPTTQFVGFSANADGSVFVGASGSKASAYVLLLVRSGRREMTLSEHKASDGSAVRPVFTPNSEQILFQSDRDGKSAIYMMQVEKLVERTEEEESEGRK